MPVNVKFGANTEELESGVARAQDSVQSFMVTVTDLSSSTDGLRTSLTATIGTTAQFKSALDATAQSTQTAAAAAAKFQDANENAASSNAGLADSARQVSGGLAETTENILNTINHLKLLALGAYAVSPALRSVVNSGAASALSAIRSSAGSMLPTLEAIGQRALPLVVNGLSFFARIGAPIGAAVVATEALNAVWKKGADLLEQYSGAERKLFGGNVDSELQSLTRFQSAIDPAVVARASELASRLDAAKKSIADFLGIQIDLTDPALKLQAVWVNIVETIAKGAGLANSLAQKTADAASSVGNSSLWNSLNMGWHMPGALTPATGADGELNDQVAKAERTLGTMYDAIRQAKATLAAGLAGGGSNFVGRFTQDIDALSGKGIPKDQAAGGDERDTDEARATMEFLQSQIQAANLAYQNEVQKLTSAAALHQTTEAQKTADTIAAINEREDKELAAANQAAQDDNLSVAQRERIESQITSIVAKAVNDRARASEQEAQHQAQIWKQAADSIASAFNSQLRGLLSGTETWSKAMKNISADLVLKFIEDQTTLTLEFLARKAQELATTVTTQAGMTAATTAGAAVRSGAEIMSGQASIAEVVANALKAIFASAGQTSAEVAAWSAPYAGPAAVGIGAAAGAAVIGSSSALAMYDVGTDYITRGGLGYLHPGETIIPAGVPRSESSGPYTGKSGGGGVHHHYNFNISTPNSRDMARALSDNNSAVMKAVKQAIKNGAHLGR